MKRIYIGVLVVLMTVAFFNSCQKAVKTEPVKPQPKMEKVEEATPKVERPELTEEEIFQRQTLEELNKQGHLKRVHFDFDKYFIRDDMKPVLQSNAEWLLKYSTVVVAIGGHCDERGTEEYNMALGEKRAISAKQYLVSLGVPAERLRTVSYGKTQILVRGVNEESHYMNRRDEFIITKK
jgi:peptidoglycan-associated lipoprotein